MSLPKEESPSNKRLTVLDTLRAVAVLMVLGRHLNQETRDGPGALANFYASWHSIGWAGVDLFFVLSGFLVSGLLFREWRETGSVKTGRFLIRRGLKIYPAFYTMLGATVVVSVVNGVPVSGRRLLVEGVFLQNYIEGIWPHTWSLALEEHFYALLAVTFGIIAGRLRRRREQPFDLPRLVVPVTAIVMAGVLMARITVNVRTPYSFLTHHYPTHLRIDALAFGVLLSYLYSFRRTWLLDLTRSHRTLLHVCSLLFLSPLLFAPLDSSFAMRTFGLTFVAVGFGLVLLLALSRQDQPVPGGSGVVRILAAIGFASYSIYLWHIPIFDWGSALLHAYVTPSIPPEIEALVLMVSAIGGGIFLAAIIETPVVKLRDRVFPSTSATPVSARWCGLSVGDHSPS